MFTRSIKVFCLFLIVASVASTDSFGQTTEFTYQGKMTDGAVIANGSYDFQFQLYDAETGGNLLGTQTVSGVGVLNGIFTVKLNFGSQFNGVERFLAISVRPFGGSTFTLLNPRQPLTSAPYSIRSATSGEALNALTADLAADASRLGGVNASDYLDASNLSTGTLNNARLGIIPITKGGTGSSTKNFVDLSTAQTIDGDKTFTGILTGNGSGISNVPGTVKWELATNLSVQAVSNRGYVANGVLPITITLPANPSIGDVVRVSAVGVGGWRIAQNAGQIVLGENIPYRSLWTPRDVVRNWFGVASSADGSKLVAVASGGQIYTSTNFGTSWTPRETNRLWKSVASSSDGVKLVAVIQNSGQIYTSADSGVSWTARETNRNWSSVASSADGTRLVASTLGGFLYTSADSGVTWIQRGSSRDWASTASSADGSRLAAAELAGPIWVSTDFGATWAPRNAFLTRDWTDVASSADGTKLVATASDSYIYTSSDVDPNWTQQADVRRWISVASSDDGTRLVAAVRGGRIYTSEDSGITWTERETNRQWTALASSADGTRLVALERVDVNGGLIFTYSATTATGTSGFVTGKKGSAIELQYIGGGQFLPVSYVGEIRTF